jgi:predicted O-methyltransferase YrrM
MLDDKILQQMQAIWDDGQQHDRQTTEYHDQWLNIPPETGKFLYQLVRSSAARRILEIGTANGYSTLWLALAAKASQGHVTSLDRSPDKQKIAFSNLQKIEGEALVSLLSVDAGQWLDELEASPVDFLFLDADRSRYVQWWPSIQRVLRPGGLVVMDNALSHETECTQFIEQVLATEGYLAETYSIGKGLFVILKDE